MGISFSLMKSTQKLDLDSFQLDTEDTTYVAPSLKQNKHEVYFVCSLY